MHTDRLCLKNIKKTAKKTTGHDTHNSISAAYYVVRDTMLILKCLEWYNYGFLPGFYRNRKTGQPGLFSKPKNRFLAACKPGFSVLNFYVQRLITRPY